MIPFAEWSRERSIHVPPLPPAEPRRLQAEIEPEEDVEELAGLVEGLAHSAQENARIEQIAHLRAAIEADCSAMMGKLAETVRAAAAQQAGEVSRHINSVLKPWIGERIAERAVSAFVEEVELAFGRKLGAELACQVPEALRCALEKELEARGLHPTLTETAGPELRALHGDTKVETVVSLWQEKLARLIA